MATNRPHPPGQDSPRPDRRNFLKNAVGLIGAAAGATLTARPVTAAATPTADLVLIRGRVLPPGDRGRPAAAVAVKGERILAVGDDQQIRRYIGRQTRRLDLAGKAVTPGLIDTHAHLPFFGLRENGFLLNLQGITDKQRVLAVLSDKAARTAAGQWIHAWGIESQSLEYLDRAQLDRISRRHPILVVHTGGQWAFANTRALAIGRVGPNTPDPPGSRIAKDVSGQPTGLLIHYPAINLVRRHCMRLTPEQTRQAILFAARLYAEQGVTSVHDNFMHVFRAGVIRAYGQLTDEGRLPVRVKMYAYLPNLPAAVASCGLTWPQAKVPGSEVERALGYLGRGFGQSAWVRRWLEMGLPYFKTYHRRLFDRMWGGYKMAVDGGGATTMWYRKPGIALHRTDHLEAMVDLCHRAGQQISVHAGGDQAVDLILSAFAKALQKIPRRDHRHRIEHAIRPTAAAFRRMAQLGIIVCTHPQWLWAWGDKFRRVESPLSASSGKSPIPLKTFLDHGVNLCFGADPPAHPEHRPQIALWQAATRISRGKYAFDKSEAISTRQALTIQTRGGAFAGFDERDLGVIAPGRLADLAVWDVDLWRAGPEQVRRARAVMTIVGGRVVHPA
jgi:predicted amidohydrolase YtcJ